MSTYKFVVYAINFSNRKMFHGYNAFDLISESTEMVKTRQLDYPRVVTKGEWRDKLLRSPPLEYATIIGSLPSKIDWDLHIPVVKTLFNRYEDEPEEDEREDPLVWCREKTPPDEYEFHEDTLACSDYPEETADECDTTSDEDYTYDPRFDAFYDDEDN